ncbi:hypothetical protein BFN03_07790 [Rhodococcus sp. WMMA185]|nr:hypothetical protein BFN03_07790 [Rhodococcus sp. WMMA185]
MAGIIVNGQLRSRSLLCGGAKTKPLHSRHDPQDPQSSAIPPRGAAHRHSTPMTPAITLLEVYPTADFATTE